VHIVGGSVGREVVGIQLGAWAARWAEAPRWYRAGCIATGISVFFGAPVTATVFIFETALVQKKRFDLKEILAVPLMAIGADLLVRAIGLSHFPNLNF
jgi:H+/Cl- antiporter ClcA